VAYVNGLAFSLGLPVVTANALELMAFEVSAGDSGPVLCLRNAGSGNVYAGLFTGDGAVAMRHGPLETVVSSLAGGLGVVSVAGTFRAEVARLLPQAVVKDTGVEVPGVRALYEVMSGTAVDPARVVAAASPLTETSAVFDAAG
jgi:tRNA A37 threonylcarbamoyladenosine modification protein TsaB